MPSSPPAFDPAAGIATPLPATPRPHTQTNEELSGLAPEHKLAGIMNKIDDRLSLLKDMLDQWHAVLAPDLPLDTPEARIPLDKIDDMLASIADLRARIAATAA